MSYHVTSRWGHSEDEPDLARMSEFLAELDAPDEEHPDTWLSHESGWTLSVFESGRVVYENVESEDGPRYLLGISRDRALALWTALARGDLAEIESESWSSGYEPPRTEEEQAAIVQRAAEMTLNMDRSFYDQLGSENLDSPCRTPGCSRGTVRFSVLCRPHHFESIRKKPCPFND